LRALVAISARIPEVQELCIVGLKDASPAFRGAALDLLLSIDPGYKELLPTALALLKDPATRQGGRTTLARMGPSPARAVPDVTTLLKDANDHTRRLAADALAGIGPPARAAAPDLLALLADGNQAVQASAINALRAVEADPKLAVPKLAEYVRRHRR